MGHRNPDRVPLRMRRGRAESVDAMRRQNWEVISHCGRCGLMMPVDLALVAKVKGAAYSLWNRKARCRRLGCTGFVTFQAKAPGMIGFEDLSADDG